MFARILIKMVLTAVLLVQALPGAFTQERLCRGSLGDNIFEEGDFGRGRFVILPRNPRLAPGYRYTDKTPLPDGFYTITNNIGAWYYNWPTWLGIGDSSDDPYGYMMVVNASFEPGIFYEQRIEGVCENTLYEFSADVINIIGRDVRDHILPNISFLIDGKEMYSTGSIRQDERWKTVGFTFQTRQGQSTVRLTLRNNAPGGVGNDLALDNISFRACGPYASVLSDSPDQICTNSPPPVLTADIQGDGDRFVQWQESVDGGRTWNDIVPGSLPMLELPDPAPGEYWYRFAHAGTPGNLLSTKCRAVSEPYKLVVSPVNYEISRTIENGQYALFAGERFTQSGEYTRTFQSRAGCDSIVTLRLTVDGVAKEPTPIIITLETSGKKQCRGTYSGYVQATAEGGVPPYRYRWNNGSASERIDNLGAGAYQLTVTDSREAMKVVEVIFEEYQSIDAQVIDIRPSLASSSGDGRAAVRLISENSGVVFQWDSGETSPQATALTAGNHSVTITADDGCSRVLSFEVPVRLMPELTAEALEKGNAIRMEQLQFRADSSSIEQASLPVLRELYFFLQDHPAMVVEIGGHTNGLPDHEYCDQLSTERAKAIADWLVREGVDKNRILYRGYGKRNPIASNATPEGRKKNQRVEVRMVEIVAQRE